MVLSQWSKWQLHSTLNRWIGRFSYPVTFWRHLQACFASFSLVSAWHCVTATYAEGCLNEGREAWKVSSFPCNKVLAEQILSCLKTGPPSTIACNALLGLFSNSSGFKDSILFRSNLGFCCCSMVNCYVQLLQRRQQTKQCPLKEISLYFLTVGCLSGPLLEAGYGELQFSTSTDCSFVHPKEIIQTWLSPFSLSLSGSFSQGRECFTERKLWLWPEKVVPNFSTGFQLPAVLWSKLHDLLIYFTNSQTDLFYFFT